MYVGETYSGTERKRRKFKNFKLETHKKPQKVSEKNLSYFSHQKNFFIANDCKTSHIPTSQACAK